MVEPKSLIDHLFRHESGKLISVLTRIFGTHNLELAEDVVQDTLLKALDHWKYHGVPENPTAWLYAVAKNKARNYKTREHIFKEKIASQIKLSPSDIQETEIDLSEKNITDSQLQMLFTLCHPFISMEAQIGLSLRILCGLQRGDQYRAGRSQSAYGVQSGASASP